ncbi:General stress protein 69 [Anaerohalosphaera lusitana]|uniref:General stress protein 69 n=1 Tax=Anaerohalosphaera lusitana TaxID=1936003 RepID=A0A1U9NHX2_9BACT|nr:aldo/keto reductase [Anaerohalosphaera lusitana]AQT67415.1 General stress protein 69 [Anaerohalosphaera lusitana]
MIYSDFGKTGAKVSAVGFGGMRFDTKNKSNEENAELLTYAVDKGINYLDTAPGYCDDKSEDIYGLAIKEMADKRDQFYVTTKGMPATYDTADKAREAVEKSLKRLNTDYIDFYHVWCIRRMSEYELAMKPGGQYEGLLKAKEEGLIKNIVISSHLRGDHIAQIMKKKEYEAVLLGLNILNFMYRWEGVQKAHDLGYGVVAMNPLSGGLIPKHEKEFSFLGEEGESATEAALRFIISCPQVNVALVGFENKEHIDMACRVADQAKSFTEEDIERVKANLSDHMNSLCTGCNYCMAGVCPQNIPIASYMQYYNDKPLFGKDEQEMKKKLKFELEWGRLAEKVSRAKDCIECAKCEQVCTQHLDIMNRLAEIAEWRTNLPEDDN